MKVKVRGSKKTITLDQSHFLAQGGEGTIYVQGDTVYKITGAAKMVPEAKFQELAVLTDHHIMKPFDILLDEHDQQVGYTTKYVKDTYMMGQIFPKTFRTRNNVTPDMMLALVRQMQSTIKDGVHAHGITIVDMNELNFLVDQKLQEIFFIDVNSYSTASYPATVIMDNIRDRHAKKVNGVPQFNEMTDWFSFGILSFMLFVGIHPFKGKYASFTDPKTSMDECMKHNISVLNPKVTYPKGATMPFDHIPEVYKQWYEAMFDRGLRLAPPADLVAKFVVVTTNVQLIKGSATFVVDELFDFSIQSQQVLRHRQLGVREIVTTTKQVYIDRHPYSVPGPTLETQFVATPRAKIVAAWIAGGVLKLHDVIDNKPLDITMNAERLTVSSGNLIVQSGSMLMEVKMNEIGSKIIPSAIRHGDVMPHTVQFFDGFVIHNTFGAWCLTIFPKSGESQVFDLKTLGGYKVVDGKYENQVLMLMCVHTATGRYDRFVFRFDSAFKKFDTRVVSDVANVGINFTVRDNGVVACVNEAENLEVFHNKINDPGVREFNDPAIEGDMILSHKGDQTLFYRGSKLYSITAGKKP